MTALDWLLSGFAFLAALALIGMAWVRASVKMRPRDLSDDEPCFDWDGRS